MLHDVYFQSVGILLSVARVFSNLKLAVNPSSPIRLYTLEKSLPTFMLPGPEEGVSHTGYPPAEQNFEADQSISPQFGAQLFKRAEKLDFCEQSMHS